jgi:hypothetical protein
MRNAGGERGGGGTRKQTDEVGLLDYTSNSMTEI